MVRYPEPVSNRKLRKFHDIETLVVAAPGGSEVSGSIEGCIDMASKQCAAGTIGWMRRES